MKKTWSLFLTLACLITLFVGLNFKWGSLPAFGNLLSPFTGALRNGPVQKDSFKKLSVPGLKESVRVYRDDSGVAHIYANSKEDMFFAQGYTLAQDRLFQMDLNTRVAAGRLSEVVGSRTIKRDEFFVSIGMRESAKVIIEKLMEDAETRLALESYSAGVNAYIDSLSDAELPIEYKIIGFKPEEWTPIRTAYLLEIMTFGLAGQTHDLELSRLAKKFGKDKIKKLFPHFPVVQDPIITQPMDTTNFVPQPEPEGGADFESIFDLYPLYMRPDEGNGSNNWAVMGSKTKSGFPIVANDTHLGYSLPNVWYEMSLNSPGFQVYGATFPAAPGIIIGFNPHIAWGVTNASVDVLDWYEVEFKDESFNEYRFDEEWRPTRKTYEEIEVRGGKTISKELIWTHHGVVVEKQGTKGLVFKWIAHQPSNGLKAFMDLNKAQNYSECKQAVSLYEFPPQNFICGDNKQIGIWHNGKHPKRYNGQGQFVMDGSKSENDWQDYIPWEEIPNMENPDSGYVRSANQHPTDQTYPYYLNWWYDDPFRAMRITELMKSDGLTVQDFEAWQNDDKDKFAERALPILLPLLKAESLSETQKASVEKLRAWNFHNGAQSVEAAVFLAWWNSIRDGVWKDQFKIPDNPSIFPMDAQTLEILKTKEKDNEWVDNVGTPDIKESPSDVVTQAFLEGWALLEKDMGGDSGMWSLSQWKKTQIMHMARIPGFDSKSFEMGGGKYNLNAHRFGDMGERKVAKHGAVWRMVVEMGPEVKGYVNFPGGISGNPFDPNYENFLPKWSEGKLREAVVVSPENSKKFNWAKTLELKP